MDDFKAEMDFNVTAPMHLFREFSPLVRKSSVKKIMVLSSALGSLEFSGSNVGPCDAYSVAKAALNMSVSPAICCSQDKDAYHFSSAVG